MDSRSGMETVLWWPPAPFPVFFLPRPNNLPSADRRVDFFLCGASLLCDVCLLPTSLTTEYLTLFRTGFVALLVGAEVFGERSAKGGVFWEVSRFWGDREAGRDAVRFGGVLELCGGGAGGGVVGWLRMVSSGISARLPPEPPLAERGSPICAIPTGAVAST